MIDTHVHLTDDRLLHQVDEVLTRALAAGVSRVLSISTDVDDARATAALARGRAGVRCAAGVHPNYSQDAASDFVRELRDVLTDPLVVAVGEIGLDYHHTFAPHDTQRHIFESQLALASELRKPVVIHSREAVADTLEVMRGFPEVCAVFHSFTGTMDEALAILAAGYLIGFTGPITYKKNDALRDIVKAVPTDRMLVETDAPYLSPEPVRKQKINEPSFVPHVARCIASVKGIALDKIEQATTDNADALFGRW